MSHFSQVKTEIKNMSRLGTALQRLGFALETSTNGVEVRGFFGATTQATAKIHAGRNYDVGFVTLPSGEVEIVGDWEILPRILGEDREAFAKRIRREYARVTVEEVATAQGLIVEEVSQPDGQIEYVLSSFGEAV